VVVRRCIGANALGPRAQAKASKLDARVAQEEKSIKVVVLKAKKMEEEAIKADSEAAAKKKQVHSFCDLLRELLCQDEYPACEHDLAWRLILREDSGRQSLCDICDDEAERLHS